MNQPQRVWRIQILSPYVSGNSRGHWRPRARMVKAIREEVALRAKAAKIPDLTGRCKVQLEYTPTRGGGPDPDNLWPTDKAAIDGLQTAGVLVNDRQQDVQRSVPVVRTANRAVTHQLTLYVTDLGGDN